MEKINNQPIIVANWKMYKTILQANEWLDSFLEFKIHNNNIIIAPPFTLLSSIHNKLINTNISLAAQDCSSFNANEGAFTGDISANMLADIGCKYVIIGHSERRKYHKEQNHIIKEKISQAHQAQLITILCIGENIEIREQGHFKQYVWNELEACIPSSANCNNTIIAYEPTWAIGTGKTANIVQIEEMHEFLNTKILNFFKTTSQVFEQNPKIIYGGSVNEENAKEILSTKYVDGLLVGGASLNAAKFYQISKSIKK